ncbi:YadA-like family protein, partial [Halomonas sp. I1]|uniref:YadA-like family protein n=1 Tax=Halomonas sp. I1 TaxID=393536 RepID=UPI0028DDCC8D
GLSNTDGNLVIAKNAADGTQEDVTFDLADDVTIGSSLTVEGDTQLGDNFAVTNNEVTYDVEPDQIDNDYEMVNKKYVDEAGGELAELGMDFAGNEGDSVHRDLGQTLEISGEASVAGTYSGANLKTVTDPATGEVALQMSDQPQFGDVTINDGDSGKITGVTAGTDATDAVNVSQLEDVGDVANAGWDLSAQGADTTNVAPGDAVDLSNTDGNLVIAKNASEGAQEDVTFDLADDVEIGNSLTVNGGPTLNDNGIDMGGDTITNVGTPTNGGDAVNLDYFNENRAHYYSVNDGGVQQGNYANDGAAGVDSLAAGVAASTGSGAERAVSLGYDVTANGVDSIAIGQGTLADSEGSVAIGRNATANGGRSTSIGDGNTATGDGAVAIGDPSTAIGDGAAVMGKDNYAEGTGAVAVGNNNTSEGDGALAIGDTNTATGNGAITMGVNNQATGNGAVAMGNDNVVTGDGAFAAGNNATSNAFDTLALGTQASATADHAMALGNSSEASGFAAFAAGNTAVASGEAAMAIGQVSTASGLRSSAIGLASQAIAEDALAVGTEAEASGLRSTSLGNYSTAGGQGAMALGSNAQANVEGSVALGARSDVLHEQSVALGAATETVRGAQTDYTGYGKDTTEDSIGEIAIAQVARFDDDGNQLTVSGNRQITGLAAGVEDTDAVNVSQLKAVDETANAGWNLSVQDGAASNVAPDGEVNLRNADGNLAISQVTDNGREEVTFDLADDVEIGNSLTINDGPTLNDNGIDMGGDTITNVGAPVNEGDAVNKQYVDETSDQLVGLGMDFSGNEGDPVHRDLGQTLAVTGEATADGTFSGTNLKTVTDPDTGAIQLQMADAPQFGDVTINEGDSGRISGLADGQDGDDAVNVSQLEDVSDVANAGWNLSAQDGAASNVAPGGEVNLRNADGNLAISQATENGREEVTFDLSDDVTIGSSLTINNGPTLNDNGIDMGGDTITNVGTPMNEGDAVNKKYVDEAGDELIGMGMNFVGNEGDEVQRALGDTLAITGDASADGTFSGSNLKTVTDPDSGEIALQMADAPQFGDVTINEGDSGQITGVADGDVTENSTDAVNGGQLWETEQELKEGQVHYYSVNDGGTQGGNYANDGASGVNAIASGVDATATADGAIAMGDGATATETDSVALGSGATTEAAVGTADITLGGQTYAFAGTSPIGTFSVGSAGAERTITNVAAGRLSADSTDAINGSQLHATNRAVESVEGRVGDVEGDVNELGDRVTNVEGDVANIGDEVDQLGDQAVKYDTNDDGSVNYDSITLEGDGGTTITNVADGDVSESSSDAVNGSQLWEVQERITNINEGGSKYFTANSEKAAAEARGDDSVAMGPESVAQGDQSVATGDGAVAESEGGVALGAGSQATREGMDGAEEAFSGESVASTQGAVSVGSDGGERQITHVAGGTQATDAVNVRQLESVQAGSVNYDRNDDGSVDYSSVTLGQEGTPTQIHNVAAGEAPTDAANVGQLQELNQQFNQQIGGVHNRIDEVERDANAGIAGVAALGNAPYVPGKLTYHVGGGYHGGESAVGVNFRRTADNGRWSLTAGAAGSRAGATLSVGISGVID